MKKPSMEEATSFRGFIWETLYSQNKTHTTTSVEPTCAFFFTKDDGNILTSNRNSKKGELIIMLEIQIAERKDCFLLSEATSAE